MTTFNTDDGIKFGIHNDYSEFDKSEFGLDFFAPLLQTVFTRDTSKTTDKSEKRATNNAIDTAIMVSTLENYHTGPLPPSYFKPLFNGGNTNPYAYAVRHMCALTMEDVLSVKYLQSKIFVIDAYNHNFEPFPLTHDHPFVSGNTVKFDGGGCQIGSFYSTAKDRFDPAKIDGHLLIKCDPFWMEGFCFGVSSDKKYAAARSKKLDCNAEMDDHWKQTNKFPAFLKSLKEIDSKCKALATKCITIIEDTIENAAMSEADEKIYIRKILGFEKRVRKLHKIIKENLNAYEAMKTKEAVVHSDKATGKKRARE